MSGRREPQVHEAARLMGQASYIYEAGCAFAIEGETTLLTGGDGPRRERHRLRADRGRAASPGCSSSTSTGGSSTTRPGTTAASSPTSSAARSTSPRPTACSRRTAPATCGCSTTARSAARWRRSRGAPTPTTWSRRWSARPGAVAAHARARGYDPADCIAVGDSVEDLEVAASVGRFFVVANGPEQRPRPARRALLLGQRDGHRGQHGRRLLRGDRLDSGRASLVSKRWRETPPSPSRSTWRSCSGSRRPGCR